MKWLTSIEDKGGHPTFAVEGEDSCWQLKEDSSAAKNALFGYNVPNL